MIAPRSLVPPAPESFVMPANADLPPTSRWARIMARAFAISISASFLAMAGGFAWMTSALFATPAADFPYRWMKLASELAAVLMTCGCTAGYVAWLKEIADPSSIARYIQGEHRCRSEGDRR